MDEFIPSSCSLCFCDKDQKMKEILMEIQSILRRKRGDLFGDVKKYLASRKVVKKTFQKVQKTLKVSHAEANNEESLAVFGDAEVVTISLFDSLFSYISGSKACGKWSVVSKLMNKKKITCEAQANEFTRVDSGFQSEKTLKMEDVQILESFIQDPEDGLESLSKSLITY